MSNDVLTFHRTNQGGLVVPGPAEWRWTWAAANGRIVAASSESYRRRIDCVKNAARVLDETAPVIADIVRKVIAGKVENYDHATVPRIFHPDVHIQVVP